jgi:cytochrome bd ubiquinol oxidase subunit II
VIAADAVGGILLASVTLYAVLGGADFGGGLWDLLVGGARRGREPRALIDDTITPVWEANHVWLVFDLVIFWTAFPHAFAAVMTTLALPLWLALLGIVLRGVGFAFRKEVHGLGAQRLFGATFAFSSLLVPFFMGTVVGAIATGRVPAVATRASLSAWTSGTCVLTGLLFTAACGYLAAVYLTGEAAREGEDAMASYFAVRAVAAGVVSGGLSLAALLSLHGSLLYSRLTGRALPLVIVAGVCGLAVVVPLVSGYRGWLWLRALAALGVAAVVWGWGVAQYPVLLPGTGVTLSGAGAPDATLVAIIWLFGIVVVLVGPSFALLFVLQGRRMLHHAAEGPVATARAGATAGASARAGASAPASASARAGASASASAASGRARTAALALVAITVFRRLRR